MPVFNLNNCDTATIVKELQYKGYIMVSGVSHKYNNEYRELMNKYYSQPIDVKIQDTRTDLSYQSGYLPFYSVKQPYSTIYSHSNSNTNLPQPCSSNINYEGYSTRISNFNIYNKNDKYQSVKSDDITPNNENWIKYAIPYENEMFRTINKIAYICAQEFNLPSSFFPNRMLNGPTTLASIRYHAIDKKQNDVIKGFDCELSLLTAFGSSSYGGLNVWTRDGNKISIKIPDGCLLIQAGKQLEYLTGGYIYSGFNEIVVSDDAMYKSNYNVIPIMYAHINNKCTLNVIDKFNNTKIKTEYPSINKGLWFQQEISKRLFI
jgi:isopenicillin N synthase-like dioxygenase